MTKISTRVALTLAVVATLIAGCGGAGSTDSDGPDSAKVAWIIAPNSLDPHLNRSVPAAEPYISPVYDQLVRLQNTDGMSRMVPMVATDWEYSFDKTALTFHLRDDVKFHDGTPLTADAVARSLDRAQNHPNSAVVDRFSSVSAVETPDEHTVVVRMTAPRSDLLYTLATSAGSIINPRLIDQDLAQLDAGSGPYTLVSVKPGDRAEYARAEDYWDPDAHAIGKVQIIGMPDDQARLNAARSGQVDAAMMRMTQYRDARSLVDSGKFGLASGNQSSWYGMYLNNSRGPLTNVDVRRAMNFAVDREGISSALLNGQCEPTGQPIQAGATGHVDGADYTYDVAKAKQLLDAAGYPDGFDLNVVTGGSLTPIASALQDQLAAVGIRLSITNLDFSEALAQWQSGNVDAFAYSHAGTPDPAITLRDVYLTSNYQGQLPQDFQATLETLLTPVDDEQRSTLLATASRRASSDALEVFLCAAPTQYLHIPSLSGFETMTVPFAGGPFNLRDIRVE
ncbi:ABC transporter substrate-binding protein [Rhodococcus artemisiae]|uniref:ABC transporter substrate-binding protein n=1 Tax=Rhodococcus artemisiae TaxID=714159 RepID=A0ABU7LC83_9NOCA|nr:ABC transporter substrate-binding protein [Rhodococcus artemisiae]MEE2059134.1 ABC transporter substrate-binding protein [Rhodococcus artemisiae]